MKALRHVYDKIDTLTIFIFVVSGQNNVELFDRYLYDCHNIQAYTWSSQPTI